MKCTMHGKYVVAILAMAGLGLLSPAQAAPPAGVACGDILGPDGGEFIMTKDLSCSEDPALEVIGPGTKLDMKGHTLECDGGQIGIEVLGTGAIVSNGTITSCGDNGVHVCGADGCPDQDIGDVPGDGNHRISGLTLTSDGIVGDDGIDVDSNNNQIVNNTVTGWPDKGILIDADTQGNQVILNYMTGNDIGIETDVGANDNIVHGNSANGNASVDLKDDGVCDNDWSDNNFGTRNQGGGCID